MMKITKPSCKSQKKKYIYKKEANSDNDEVRKVEDGKHNGLLQASLSYI